MTSRLETIVLLGPSLSQERARELLPGAVLRPPAARGDILAAALEQPQAIALIDGYFDHRLSVQHKEILWALAQGIRVYGCSSLGALRAAELDLYGMVGIGQCYEAFASGELDHDDEVVLTHGEAPAYAAGSEALINMRCTLKQACQQRVISEALRERLVGVARALFYPDRNYPRLLAEARRAGEEGELLQLEQWLRDPSHRIDQKRADAELLLRHLRDLPSSGPTPLATAEWELPWTAAWDLLWKEVTSKAREAKDGLESSRLTALEESKP